MVFLATLRFHELCRIFIWHKSKEDINMKTQAYKLETPTTWQRIFLQSRVNGAPYDEEQHLSFKWRWPENTYLQRRLQYLRTFQLPDRLN
jgi:hypothetical protein